MSRVLETRSESQVISRIDSFQEQKQKFYQCLSFWLLIGERCAFHHRRSTLISAFIFISPTHGKAAARATTSPSALGAQKLWKRIIWVSVLLYWSSTSSQTLRRKPEVLPNKNVVCDLHNLLRQAATIFLWQRSVQ